MAKHLAIFEVLESFKVRLEEESNEKFAAYVPHF